MANPKKKTSKKAAEADSDSQEKSDLDKKRELFQKAAGLLGYHPDETEDEK